MIRERALKVVLVIVGLLFTAGIYPVTVSLWKMNESDYGDDMMLSLYVALGVFLLMAVRNPSANRSLIAFTAWSSFAHAAVYDRASSPHCQRTRRIFGRRGRARCHRCGTDRPGSRKSQRGCVLIAPPFVLIGMGDK
jgi:uncharacterized paraquat-inducible protein A